MATPLLKDYSAAMHDFAGQAIATYVRSRVKPGERVLDAGAGWGKYRWLLPEYEMDAVDIWEPYVVQEKLDGYYRKVFIADLFDFVPPQRYKMVIMGDTLEHIPVERAQKVVRRLAETCDDLIIAVPFEMEQEAVHGNEHEAHQQDDLTEEVMAKRYPQLELLCLSPAKPGEHYKAIYVKRKKK